MTTCAICEQSPSAAGLPTYRTNVEKKATDAQVDKAGAPDPLPEKPKDDKKKK